MNSVNKYFLCAFFFLLPFIAFSAEATTVVRAALDIGSGATKLRVAEVNLKTQKIERVLVNESFVVQYHEELEKSTDHTFNEKVMETGLEALKKSKEIALKHNAENVVAVATASFRKAANVQQFIDKIYRETGIKVHIIDQQLEGILAFVATSAQANTDPSNLVVWDIGGGSFQFSALDQEGNISVYRGTDASIPFKNHIIKAIKKADPIVLGTPNPFDVHEMRYAEYDARLIAKRVDIFFKKKIRDPQTKIIGIGNIFAYGIYPLVGRKDLFTKGELSEKVQLLAGKTDKDLGGDAYVNVAVSNSILVLGFMRSLHIHQMNIMDINNADGALLHADFWKGKKETQVSETTKVGNKNIKEA